MDAVKYLKEKRRMTQRDQYGCCHIDCKECDLSAANNKYKMGCIALEVLYPEKAVEIVEKWFAENPAKTRQSEFLKLFPDASKDAFGVLKVCPNDIESSFKCKCEAICNDCRKEYWLAEVE